MSSNTVPSTRRVSCSTKGSRIVPGGGVGGREGRISEPIGEPETEHENSNSRVSSRELQLTKLSLVAKPRQSLS